MAAGEYVSVSSQADTERADLARERRELETDDANERKELTSIYMERGLDQALAEQVTEQLMKHDALEAHARDELGISVNFRAQPVQAAFASAASFTFGAAMPLLIVFIAPRAVLVPIVFGATLVFLAGLGSLSALTGGAPILRPTVRVTFWGAFAMGLTAGIGALFGRIV